MKILLIGLGSIGSRHLQNILSLGYSDVTVVSRSGILPEEFSALKVYSSLQESLEGNSYDAAIICNPTAQHIATLATLLTSGITNIYLEKPVGHSLTEVEEFVSNHPVTPSVFVGYDLHFDPGFEKLQSLLSTKEIGEVISANSFVGQYLPDWRPQEDYRQGMSAKTETGGGVMLDLIHEFDYLYSFFGAAETIACMYKNSNALQIETEDVADVLIKFQSGCSANIHLDYLQQKLVRFCIITGSKGSITWNLADRSVTTINSNKEESIFPYNEFERNDRFVAIMKAFLENKSDARLTTFASGVKSLKMVEAAKLSSQNKKFITLQNMQSIR